MILADKKAGLGEMCYGTDLFTRNLILTALGSNAPLFGGGLGVSRQFYYNPHVLAT
jgi:hypothetical protein